MSTKISFYTNYDKYEIIVDESLKVRLNQLADTTIITLVNNIDSKEEVLRYAYNTLMYKKNDLIKMEYSVNKKIILSQNYINNSTNLSLSYKLTFDNGNNETLEIMYVNR